ncbi:MAG TPA: ABC transporter ATP-binding protein [Dysgonamonadaceae bacterium]|nr:ABC transporter ATP-binding protein [Erysipelotrichia bacterium]HKM44330.1 ABC transporter ATP-binding protein [Dysgonamonadaceae bacterium]
MNVISVKNLTFAYEKDKNVLENLSLDIKENTINAILGANGGGKSTLLDCLVGLNKPSGLIYIKEKQIGEYTNKEFAREVAYISQSTTINIDYSVREFILFGRNPYLNLGQSPSEKDYKKAESYAVKMGIEHLLNKSITKISGGERQLAFICRALVQESDIFIFDEPLSALDFGNQNKLLMIFKELQSEGKTIIFTTHNPNQVLDLNCNVVVLNNKKVVAEGLANDVIVEELLETIYKGKVSKSSKHYTFSE